MAGDESVHGGGSESRKTSKVSTEYRKTESETHEVERGGDYEKRVVSSETHETSVKRSKSVEIRRGVGQAFQPDVLPADWFSNLPDKLRLSILGVQPHSTVDGPVFDGDYILDLVDRDAAQSRWEVQFAPQSRLYRATLTARPRLRELELRAALEGGVPGPRWTGASPAAFDQAVTLRLDSSLVGDVAAGWRWPETVTLTPLRAPVGQAFQPDASGFGAARFDIPSRPTAAERAAMGSASSSSGSSSSGGGGPDHTTDCHCVSTCPCCKSGTRTPMSAHTTSVPNSPMHIEIDSDRPVRYGNGEITLAVTDLSAGGFGQDFGHTRIFSNRLGGDVDYGNGYNWLIRDLPHLVEQGAGTIMAVRGTRSALWFDLVGGVYVGRYGTKFTLAHDASSGAFNLAAPNGQVTVFNDFGSALPGLFRSQSTAGGQTIQVTSYAPGTALGIGEVQRTFTTGGVTTTESFLYSFSGFDVVRILWRRSTDGGATWTNVRQVLYTYYGALSTNGSPGDLESATVQTWDGSAWQTIDNNYYRYWTYTGGGGLLHCLKYVLGSAAFDRMTAAGLDPTTASDSVLSGYADLYLEYDSDRHVTLETTNGGLYTFTFAFTTNSNATYFDDYNNWKTKTIETRPDGSVNTVYCNFVNDVILKQLANGSDAWIKAVHYNERADVDQFAYPSAVAGFNDAANDLAIAYNATSGLIRTYTYFGDVAPGYTQSESVQQGMNGTPVLLKQCQYTQVMAGGVTIYPTVELIQYRDDAGTQPLLTSFGFTFHPGTTAVQERTTTWPVVSAAQNGSGIAETRSEQFDPWGNQLSLNDERGAVTEFIVDVVTSGVLQRIDDATDMALVTDLTLDNLGRTTQALGPPHTIDLGGVATVVRTAMWWIYQDALNQVWTAQGYATGASPSYAYTLVNPVSIVISDSDGNITDRIQAVRSSASGPLLPTDAFPQSTWSRWTHNVLNDKDQVTATQVYFLIPATGSGTKGANYNETDVGFDSMGRQNRVVSGGGTIQRTVHDPRSLALSIWYGTNDTGATDT